MTTPNPREPPLRGGKGQLHLRGWASPPQGAAGRALVKPTIIRDEMPRQPPADSGSAPPRIAAVRPLEAPGMTGL